MSQTRIFTYLHYSLKLQILSFASCSNNKPRTSKVSKINYASLQNFFTWTGLFWNQDDVHWHGFAFEAFDRFHSTFCIYRYGMLERTEPITITINLFKQAIHFVFIKIYIQNEVCCCLSHKIMKLPLTINLGLL